MALVFAVALGGAAAIRVALGWTEPYWVPEPILVLTLYVTLGQRDRIQWPSACLPPARANECYVVEDVTRTGGA